ncbi:MAG: thiopurine S-methyltransferase [Gammaproteobacteria bacterium]|nr:thiopurine S-methyltransferase [Gammaproteobacteria bacterium]MBT8134660.1 thiopurine S-methyltransferase [Gammaproteobacteria bacterium]NNJ49001.1 thiopurine S-methyltransferase [Gammaproteobacteria bacterium]
MEITFWLERWSNNQTGFHQQKINPYLMYFYGEKGPAVEQREKLKVFVPLCGKSKDMLWLSQNRYRVFGVECSDLAVKGFFEENALNYKYAEKGQHALYQSSDLPSQIEIFQGDFFELQASDLEDVTDIFDRASLVALPVEMRQSYADKMAELQKPGVRTLLVTLTFDHTEMNGPPFSVTEDEVNALYANNFSVQKLLFKDVIEEEHGLRNRGLTSLVETVYKLVRK